MLDAQVVGHLMFKRIVFSHGLCTDRVQWCCEIGSGNEDSSARVKIRASSCQHGRWTEVSDLTRFEEYTSRFQRMDDLRV